MANVGITSFNGGEASPLIDTRLDIDKYRSLCRVLENMIPTIYGAAVKRPGTKFMYKVFNPVTAGILEESILVYDYPLLRNSPEIP